MYFDTHAHYDEEAFDSDRAEVLTAMPAAGVSLILNPGCDGPTSQMAVELSRQYPFVYAAVGWHPHEASAFTQESEAQLRAWAQEDKVKAIGEIGLDFHYDFSPRETQQAVFRRQLELARELNLPVIVHDREAHAPCLEAVRAFPEVRGVFHCYSGSAEMAQELLNLGWYLSFTGAITFKNARRALEAIAVCPMERLMLETDSPYLAPVPNRGTRNDSRNLPYIAQVVAEVKGLSVEEVAAITMENGKRFFSIAL